jgi:hypothetical protein
VRGWFFHGSDGIRIVSFTCMVSHHGGKVSTESIHGLSTQVESQIGGNVSMATILSGALKEIIVRLRQMSWPMYAAGLETRLV